MSTVSGRHLEEPSTSTYVRYLQVFSSDIDTFWMMMIAFITIKSSLVPLIEGLCAQMSVPNFLHFFSWKCLKNKPFCVCVRVCLYINMGISIHDSAFFQHMYLVFLGFFSMINRYAFEICHRHSQGTLSTFDIDICRHLNRHPYKPLPRANLFLGNNQYPYVPFFFFFGLESTQPRNVLPN